MSKGMLFKSAGVSRLFALNFSTTADTITLSRTFTWWKFPAVTAVLIQP